MFSDRYRLLKIILICIALIGLLFYAYGKRKDLTLARCRTDPVRFAGAEVPLYVDSRLLEIEPDRILVSQPGGDVTVMVPAEKRPVKARPGEHIEAITIFRREGYLELKKIRTAPLRKLKIVISIPPLLLLAFLLIKSLRWEKGRLVIKESPITKIQSPR